MGGDRDGKGDRDRHEDGVWDGEKNGMGLETKM